MQYAVEICKMMNKRKSMEDCQSISGKNTIWEFKSEKNKKYEKPYLTINYVEKIGKRLA